MQRKAQSPKECHSGAAVHSSPFRKSPLLLVALRVIVQVALKSCPIVSLRIFRPLLAILPVSRLPLLPLSRLRKGTNRVSTNGVTANFMLLTGFWGLLPLTYFYIPKSARAYLLPRGASRVHGSAHARPGGPADLLLSLALLCLLVLLCLMVLVVIVSLLLVVVVVVFM